MAVVASDVKFPISPSPHLTHLTHPNIKDLRGETNSPASVPTEKWVDADMFEILIARLERVGDAAAILIESLSLEFMASRNLVSKCTRAFFIDKLPELNGEAMNKHNHGDHANYLLTST